MNLKKLIQSENLQVITEDRRGESKGKDLDFGTLADDARRDFFGRATINSSESTS